MGCILHCSVLVALSLKAAGCEESFKLAVHANSKLLLGADGMETCRNSLKMQTTGSAICTSAQARPIQALQDTLPTCKRGNSLFAGSANCFLYHLCFVPEDARFSL